METQTQKTGSLILKKNCELDLTVLKTFSIDKINKLQGVEIHTLQHHFLTNPKPFQDAIMKLVIDLSKALNLQNSFNADQIRQIPDMFYDEEFSNLTLEDVALICRRMKTGLYGTFFRMDQPTFFDVVRKYASEKLEKIYQEHDKEKEELQWKDIRVCDNNQKKINEHRQALARYLTEKK